MLVLRHLTFTRLSRLSALVIALAASSSHAGDVCPSSAHNCFRTGDPTGLRRRCRGATYSRAVETPSHRAQLYAPTILSISTLA